MHKLSFTIILTLIALFVLAQSPHGKSFRIDCAQCHTSSNWNVNRSGMLFNHDNTSFNLVGQHKSVNCRDCHTSLDFKDKRQSCAECHTDMHNSTLGKDCARCHTPKSWIIENTTEMHQQSRFPLLGAHRTANCTSCHQSSSSLQFEPIGIECNNCHQKDFQNTTSPNHVLGGYSTNCIECHSSGSASWNTALVNHDFFPLTAGHSLNCIQCHVTGTYGKLPTDCNSCHQKNYTAAQVPSHVAAGIPNTCATCHTTTGWKPSSFNHTTTGFELKGGHKTVVQCSDCHKGNLTAATPECIKCHQVQYDNAPNHKKLVFSTNCTTCHTQNNWLENSFNHATTSFPLTGTHTTVECALCHTTSLAGTSTICNGCHQKNYTAALVPSHMAAGIPNDCATCHTTTGWKPSSFNHTTTGFELKGGHKTLVQCSDCHKGNLTAAAPECIKCHQVQYDNAPSHKQSGYSTNCVTCHGSGSTSWSNAQIDHSFFPLTAGHSLSCIQCHVTGTYGKLPTDCNSCHQKNYTAAQIPNHVAAGIPNTCTTCHNTAGWKPSSFNHTTATGYELKGGHKTIVQCSDCHKGNLTAATPECIKCHQVQYDNAPNHKKLVFSTNCTTCHSQNNWLENSFNHATTSFPLTGAHTTVECALCHTTSLAGTSTVCNSCHQKNYIAVQIPSHVAAGIPNDCATCHTTTGWKPSSFNHTTTGFELKGGHKTVVQCSDCHKGNLNAATPECIKCHQVQYDNAPNHKKLVFSTNCTTCHSQNNWLENSFNHSTTNFPLTGAHTTVECALCHTISLAGTSTVCNGCHQKNYTAALVPGHVAAGIPIDCATCHTSTAWKPSSFNHITTGFELKGGHKTVVQCSDCHKGNLNAATQECITCHQVQYDKTTNPNHKGAGFPTNCEICHSTNNWTSSTYNHSAYFPISSGRHKLSCNSCHTNTSNFAVFTCVTASCHTRDHNQNQGSAGCYRCHPTGKGD